MRRYPISTFLLWQVPVESRDDVEAYEFLHTVRESRNRARLARVHGSIINQAAEEAINQGVVVVAAAGNSGAERKHSIPPANSPSVITVGGYDDKNDLDPTTIDLYHSNFGPTADGFVKPELIAPAMWVAAPILPRTGLYERAETLSRLLAAPDYELSHLAGELADQAGIPHRLLRTEARAIRAFLESVLSEQKIIAAHY